MTKQVYDLEERTFHFAKRIRLYTRKLLKNTANIEDSKQVARASGSVGANYIEANESLGKKDFLMRIKICRKEAKESTYWLRLINTHIDDMLKEECDYLQNESVELMNIFGAILRKSS